MSAPPDSTAASEPTDATTEESTHDSTSPSTGTSSGRRRLPTILVVVATCIAVLSTLTTWVKTQALDTDEWVAKSDELLADPQIRDALSVYLADQLFTVVDVGAALEGLLPEQLSGLAGPLAGAFRGPAGDAVDQLLASQRFADLWSSANRVTHERVVAILREETTSAATSVSDGTVTLELGVILRALGESLGIPASALDRIPPDAGQITVFQSDQLASAQTAVQILDFLSWFLFIVVVALYALAVFLARDRERMLFKVGVALVVGGLSVLMLRAIGVRRTVDAVVEDANRSIGRIVGEIATRLLQEIAWTGITFGLLIAVFAALLTDHRWAVAVRRALARFTASTGGAIAAAVLILLGLMWWSPGRAFDRWVTALTLIALAIAAVAVLVRRIRSEFPAASDGAVPPSAP
jgi:hypothetical protein